MSTPVPITATVAPPAASAPRCAAASMPRASPLTTTTPAAARSDASCSATASPYGEGRREPTMAARGPSGGGHRPRVWSAGTEGKSRGCILQPVAEGFEHMLLADLVRAVEVGGGAGDPPGPVKAPRREPLLLGPALERPSRRRVELGLRTQARGLEHRVETALPVELPAPRQDDPFAHGRRRFALRLVGEQAGGHPAHGDLQVDPVQQRP